MSSVRWPRRIAAFLVTTLLVAAWGSVVQTQFNLAALESIGATISPAVRWQATLHDLLGFGPLYAAMVGVALLLAFALAGWMARRIPLLRPGLFALAGWLALIVAIRSIDAIAPPPVLIAATRSIDGLLWMTLGAALGGLIFARLTRPAAPR
jgi:hypothetical protein